MFKRSQPPSFLNLYLAVDPILVLPGPARRRALERLGEGEQRVAVCVLVADEVVAAVQATGGERLKQIIIMVQANGFVRHTWRLCLKLFLSLKKIKSNTFIIRAPHLTIKREP